MRNKILRELDSGVFESLDIHDLEESEFGRDDLPSRQLIKAIINSFLDIRLFRYGQYFTEKTLKKNKSGIRQQSNKLVLFKGMFSLFCRNNSNDFISFLASRNQVFRT